MNAEEASLVRAEAKSPFRRRQAGTPPRRAIRPNWLFSGLPVLLLVVAGCSRPSSEVQTLRAALVRAAGPGWERQLELGVGAVTLGMARGVLALAKADPEARAALATVRGAEVSLYECRRPRRELSQAALLTVADQAMAARNWERVVGVISGHELVAVYVPRSFSATSQLRVCVAVVDRSQLVVASARANPEPLLALAQGRSSEYWHRTGRGRL